MNNKSFTIIKNLLKIKNKFSMNTNIFHKVKKQQVKKQFKSTLL